MYENRFSETVRKDRQSSWIVFASVKSGGQGYASPSRTFNEVEKSEEGRSGHYPEKVEAGFGRKSGD